MPPTTLDDRIVDFLVAIPGLDDFATRGTLLRNMPTNLTSQVPRSSAKVTDLSEFVRFARHWRRLAPDRASPGGGAAGEWATLVLLENARRLVAGTQAEGRLNSLQAEFQEAVADGEPPDTGPPPDTGRAIIDILLQIRAIGADISLRGSLHAARRKIPELTTLALESDSLRAREAAIGVLKDVLLTDLGGDLVSSGVREIRRLIIKAVSSLRTRELGLYFTDRELEHQDLWSIDFTGQTLKDVSFRRAFMIESLFNGADLRGASFADAYVRNVHFEGAILDRVDLSGADWFNAVGLTPEQLRRADVRTLLPCPRTEAEFLADLDDRYALPESSWEQRVRAELRATWAVYTKPGELADLVDSWRKGLPDGGEGAPQLRPLYDELASLEADLSSVRFRTKRQRVPLSDVVRTVAAKLDVPDWSRVSSRQFMDVVAENYGGPVTDDVYWWLVVLGFLRFNDVDVWFDGRDPDWGDSVDYTRLAPRGAAYMEGLKRRG